MAAFPAERILRPFFLITECADAATSPPWNETQLAKRARERRPFSKLVHGCHLWVLQAAAPPQAGNPTIHVTCAVSRLTLYRAQRDPREGKTEPSPCLRGPRAPTSVFVGFPSSADTSTVRFGAHGKKQHGWQRWLLPRPARQPIDNKHYSSTNPDHKRDRKDQVSHVDGLQRISTVPASRKKNDCWRKAMS